jgi:hypothetical protein
MLKIDNTNFQTIESSLCQITSDLILNYKLKVNDQLFSFIDLEAYYFHSEHPDEYAKGIEHTRPAGELELHRYGIDISLGNSETEGLGGILIRGLYCDNDSCIVNKSGVVRKIFSSFNMGKNHIEIVQEKSRWISVFRSRRLNLGEAKENKVDFVDKMYKFIAKDKDLFKAYPDKEWIIKNSNLSEDERTALLGYTLK